MRIKRLRLVDIDFKHTKKSNYFLLNFKHGKEQARMRIPDGQFNQHDWQIKGVYDFKFPEITDLVRDENNTEPSTLDKGFEKRNEKELNEINLILEDGR